MIEKILALNSLVNVLTLKERIWLQKQRIFQWSGFLFMEAPTMVIVLKSLIHKHNWVPPKRKYNTALDEVFYNEKSKEWDPIDTYNHPIIQETINQIPIKE